MKQLSESLSIQTLGNVLLPDGLTPFQVGKGSRHFKNAGVGAGREAEFFRHHFQQPVSAGIRFAELPYLAGGHVGVAMDLDKY
jgi:hypothetical protein